MRLTSSGKPPASLKADCTAAKETVLHCLLPRASPWSAVSACSCCPSAPCHRQASSQPGVQLWWLRAPQQLGADGRVPQCGLLQRPLPAASHVGLT